MPIRLPPPTHKQPFTATTRVWPPHARLHAVHTAPHPGTYHNTNAGAQRMGRLGRWYLPAMGIIALSFAIANGVHEYDMAHLSEYERRKAEEERNKMLLDAYGERMSMSDVEKALEVWEVQ